MRSKAGLITLAATAALLIETPVIAGDGWQAKTPEVSEKADMKIADGLTHFVEEEFQHAQKQYRWHDHSRPEY